MRNTGNWLVGAGIAGALVALMMDVSVDAGYGQRVNNIGLMSDRQNYLMLAVVAIIVGVILIVADKSPRGTKPAKAARAAPPEPLPYGIEEKDGLFVWAGQAFPSREDAIAHVKQRLAVHALKAHSKVA